MRSAHFASKCLSDFGTGSERGRGFVERMLTVVGSLKAQGEEVMGYLEAAIRAAAGGYGRRLRITWQNVAVCGPTRSASSS